MNKIKNNKKLKGRIKLSIFLAMILGAFFIGRYMGLDSIFSGGNWYRYLEEVVEQNFLRAVIIYLVVTVITSVVFAVPGVTFAIAAGIVFGPVWGTFLCTLGATLGAMVSFIVGRFFLQDALKDRLMKNRYIKKLLFSGNSQNDIIVLMVTRLVPIFPYNLQNFAYGITEMDFKKYSIGSFVFMIPGTAMYTVGASAVTSPESRVAYIVVACLIGVVVTFTGRMLKKRYVESEESLENGCNEYRMDVENNEK